MVLVLLHCIFRLCGHDSICSHLELLVVSVGMCVCSNVRLSSPFKIFLQFMSVQVSLRFENGFCDGILYRGISSLIATILMRFYANSQGGLSIGDHVLYLWCCGIVCTLKSM